MTSIEWLIEQTRKPEWHSLKRGEIFEIAKEMHNVEASRMYSEVFEWLSNKDYLTDKVDILRKEFEQFKKK